MCWSKLDASRCAVSHSGGSEGCFVMSGYLNAPRGSGCLPRVSGYLDRLNVSGQGGTDRSERAWWEDGRKDMFWRSRDRPKGYWCTKSFATCEESLRTRSSVTYDGFLCTSTSRLLKGISFRMQDITISVKVGFR